MGGNGLGWPYEPVAGAPAPPPSTAPIEAPPQPRLVEPEPPFSRRAVVLLAIGGTLALLLAVLAVGDWWVRNAELRTLLGRVERAERAQIPAVQSIGPLLSLCQLEGTGGVGEFCDTVAIRRGAEQALPQLRQAGDAVATTRLTSFHDGVRTFRDRYVDHNLAWRAWLEALAEDPTVGGFEPPEAIGTTFERASTAADGALTPLPLHDNGRRVEQIFLSVR